MQMKGSSLLTAAALCLVASCTPADQPAGDTTTGQTAVQVVGREVALRVSDLRGAAAAVVQGSTAEYPRVTIKDDTRLSIALPKDGHDKRRTVVPLTLPEGAAIHLSYGIQQAIAAPATMVMKMASGGSERTLLTAKLTKGQPPGWTNLSLPLDGLQGEATLTVEVASADPANEAPRMSLSAPVVTKVASAKRPPNVILISLDTLRADHMGIYGYHRDTSPRMDELFETEGMVVDRVISQAADTFYGHMALFVGMRPSTPITFVPFGRTKLSRLHSWALTLPEVFRAAGYRTAAFTENALLMGGGVFNRGYEVYHEEKGIEKKPKPQNKGGKNGFTLPKAEGHIEWTFDRGLEWLEGHTDQPVFMFLHTYQVHSPYQPPESYAYLYPTPHGSPDQRIDIDRYDREIRYTDDQVYLLVEKLRSLGILDNTILIITSDHGEEFGEHGAREHGAHLNSEALHVPLLIRAPGLLPAGVRREGPFGLVDLMPTLLDLLGLDTPPNVTGSSLASHLLNGTVGSTQPLYSEARSLLRWTYEHGGKFGLDPDWKGPGFSVTSWPYRLVKEIGKNGPSYSLFHLDADPGELWNFYHEDMAEFDEMKRALDEYDEECERRRAQWTDAFKAAKDGAEVDEPAPVEMDDARKEKLRALGYIQ